MTADEFIQRYQVPADAAPWVRAAFDAASGASPAMPPVAVPLCDRIVWSSVHSSPVVHAYPSRESLVALCGVKQAQWKPAGKRDRRCTKCERQIQLMGAVR